MNDERHDPMLASTGRNGCWCNCTCGWTSPLMTSVSGAHVEFGKHLVDVSREMEERP